MSSILSSGTAIPCFHEPAERMIERSEIIRSAGSTIVFDAGG